MLRTAVIALVILTLGGTALWLGRHWQEQSNPGALNLDDAWRLVRQSPRSGQAWASLADAQAAMDQSRAAEESYRMAMRLGHDHPEVEGRLGFLLYGRGQDQSARRLLAQAHRRGAELPMLEWTLKQLQSKDLTPQPNLATSNTPTPVAPPSHAESESPDEPVAHELPCEVALVRDGSHGTFRIEAVVAGEPVDLVVDTGASLSALSETLLDELGIAPDPDQTINAITATGPATFALARIPTFEIGGRIVDDVTVAVCPQCGGSQAAGLLGLDLQAAVGLELDLSGLRARFWECTDDQ